MEKLIQKIQELEFENEELRRKLNHIENMKFLNECRRIKATENIGKFLDENNVSDQVREQIVDAADSFIKAVFDGFMPARIANIFYKGILNEQS